MKSLRERLAQFDRATPVRNKARAPIAPALGALLEAGARWEDEGPSGHLRLDRVLDASAVPSARPVAEDFERLGLRAPVGSRWTALDTETTGLESGTGTLVFVVGLLHWEPAGARLVQLFLPEPAGEGPFLEAMLAELADTDLLLSYNGASFDLPRLRSRLRLHRLDESLLSLPHLDLLHPTRRVVRDWLLDSRLGRIEREVLDRAREHDVPGEEAPRLYRELQIERRDAGLRGVLEHNAVDIETLPHLARWLCGVYRGECPVPPRARLAVARALVERGRPGEAETHLETLVAEETGADRCDAYALLARLARRRLDDDAAHRWLSRWIEESPRDTSALVEMAKLCEHRRRDLGGARDCVRRALDAESLRMGLGVPPGARAARPLLHRLRRIERKIARRSTSV